MNNKVRAALIRASDLALAAEKILLVGEKLPLELVLALNQFRFAEAELGFLLNGEYLSINEQDNANNRNIVVDYWPKKH